MNIAEVKQVPGYHPITMALIGLLEANPVGTVLTDTELTATAGFPCSPNNQGYGYLQSAIRHVLKSKRVVWQRIRNGSAIKALSGDETVETIDGHIGKIRRESKRITYKSIAAHNSGVSEEKKRHLSAQVGIAGTIHLLCKSDTVKKIELTNTNIPDKNKLLSVFS